ncbi:LytR/AlgR family response regulator transcription factor [Christensenella intestinihominis]|uniref:LytR/AlgR family response regulator transcription factor n=1 Tax=Christensenella intestinihominis TaxID=1851429 RepID=UPI0011C82DD8|nr:LytTR family DNA-binding domain-containing protein [Christensenella intestinihominis]
MEAIYSHDVDTFLEWLDDQILWISSLTGYALSGHDSIRKVMKRMPVHEYSWKISDEQYTIVAEDACSCTASGSYTLNLFNGKNISLTLVQQLSFRFILVNGFPKVAYMHHSNIWADKKYDDIFFRNRTFDLYLRMYQWTYGKLQQKEKEKCLTIRDTSGITHILADNEILYVSAKKNQTILHCLKGCIEIATGISKTATMLPKHFLRVHRSYLVNTDYVIEIGRYYIMLAGGARIPVPARQYSAIKKELGSD